MRNPHVPSYAILRTYEKYVMDPQASSQLLGMGIGLTTNEDVARIDVFDVVQERYKIADNYKIELKGYAGNGTPNASYYQSDLRHTIESDEDSVVGFYDREYVTDEDDIEVGDLVGIFKCGRTTEIGENLRRTALVVRITKVRRDSRTGILGWLDRQLIRLFGKFSFQGVNSKASGNIHMDLTKSDRVIRIFRLTKVSTSSVLCVYNDEEIKNDDLTQVD